MELESAFVSHKSIAEAAVTSMPYEKKGESAIAFVVLRTGFSNRIIYAKNLLLIIECCDQLQHLMKSILLINCQKLEVEK
jgi:acyl-coenzyme A synthetase/AMP-(fatty) acid ligase